MAITTVFFDVGGVLLTNGWDRHCRRHVIDEFGADWEEFRDRHEFVAQYFETGKMNLDEYLERTLFYRNRDFTRSDFVTAMKAASMEIPGSLDVVRQLAKTGLFLATLNNESRELNEHRIDTFGLRSLFSVFLSSCYLGFKKPEAPIYRMAMELTQRSPGEVLFVDDRKLNLECAIDQGMTGIEFTSAQQLRKELVRHGLLD